MDDGSGQSFVLTMNEEAENFVEYHQNIGVMGLLPYFEHLDNLLRQVLQVETSEKKEELWNNGFRGLYLGLADVESLLDERPLTPKIFSDSRHGTGLSGTNDDSSQISKLSVLYSLSDFEIDVLLLALAPEIDSRYERLYAYLQDDVTRKRPTINLALDLLCNSAEEKITNRKYFQQGSPLVDNKVIHLEPNQVDRVPIFLSSYIRLDEQVVSYLLNEKCLDSRLVPICQKKSVDITFSDLMLDENKRNQIKHSIEKSKSANRAVKIYLRGHADLGQSEIAEAIANELGLGLIIIDQERMIDTNGGCYSLIDTIEKEGRLKRNLLFAGLTANDNNKEFNKRLLNGIINEKVNVVLSGTSNWSYFNQNVLSTPTEVDGFELDQPDFINRKKFWKASLDKKKLTIGEEILSLVASRFRFSYRQIQSAITILAAHNSVMPCSRFVEDGSRQPVETINAEVLMRVAREQCESEIASLAKKIDPIYRWNDLVLPYETKNHLNDICQQVACRERVLEEWGFAQKLSNVKGITVAFVGLPGTGKTMAAEVLSTELGYDLYKIDLSGVVSKYIGETEKNLDRIFAAAERSDCILFFDEADALFGKRSEIHDAHDRYANIEISYLLQKMEEYEGLTIIATNLQQNLDQAFIRRFTHTIHFPFPDQENRYQIWKGIWPEQTPLNDDVILDKLARHFKLSGGNIKNIAVAAASFAASEGSSVTMPHLLRATQREYQKMGKVLSPQDLECCEI